MYPQIEESSCTDCGACIRHCPIMSEVETGKNPEIYASKFNDTDTILKSASGGIFMALASYVLDKNGVIFGCAYDENLVAKHIAVENKDDLKRLQSSKYVQSDTQGIYSEVKNALKNGRYVLFSGTGCQVAGLKAFLGKSYEKLLTADIVCHGVPSPLLFEKYVEYKGKKLGGKLVEYNFRTKEKYGWDKYYKISDGRKSKIENGSFDPYYNAFLVGKTLRESCYKCKFANVQRAGDITIGDYWGIQKIHPEFFDENGVSIVLVNSEKGKSVWREIAENITSIPSGLEKELVFNGNLSAPSQRPACRDTAYDGIDGDFDLYVKTKLAFKMNSKTKIKQMIPPKVKRRILKLIGK